MECIVCRINVSRSSDAAYELSSWETDLGRLKEKATGRVAHIACLRGEDYNEQQLTIQDGIKEE